MPIEIKELHIRVAVNAPPAATGGTGQDAAGTAPAAAAETEKETLVAECVEQVLQILKNRAER